jgi:hypothetical protein
MRAFPRHPAFAPALALALATSSVARADPYRLRVDSVAYTQSPQSPVGLIILQGDGKANPWVDAEAMAWAGNANANYNTNGNYDVLTAMVRVHDPKNYAQLRLGRQLLTVGALRPVHVDGADLRLRSPMGTSVEAFGGVPVEPQFAYRAYDWLAGARLGQSFGSTTNLGVSYLQQREDKVLAYEEAGVDLASAPARWLDLAAHGAYDLIDPGIAEAGASIAGRFGDLRPEIYAVQRSPSRLIPATSLFSALGDTPAQTVGGSLKWRMFPRLDVLPLLAVRDTGGYVGLDGTLRVTLRLDDRGAGALSVEARRQGSGTDLWSGARVTMRVPLAARLVGSTELELVVPDDPRGRGSIWPWGLVAVRWTPAPGWEVAGAVEAASTPTAVREVNALARLGWMWGGR